MSYKHYGKKYDSYDMEDIVEEELGDHSSNGYKYSKGLKARELLEVQKKESYKRTTSPNPKPILKDSTSGSKPRRNILINENANELHSISKKTEQSSADKERQTASFRAQDLGYSQSGSVYSALSRSENSRSGNKYDKIDSSDEDDSFQEKLQARASNFRSRDDGTKPSTDTDLKASIESYPKKDLTEFQKAHVRKLQHEREHDLYSKFLKQSAEKIREKWREEKERSIGKSPAREIMEGRSVTDTVKSKSPLTAKTHSTARTADTYAKFTKIENKIADLEKDLDVYQRNLRERYEKEQRAQDGFDKAYNRIDSKVRALKNELNKSHERSVDKDDRMSKAEAIRRLEEEEEEEESETESEEEEEEEELKKPSPKKSHSKSKKSVEFSKELERPSHKSSHASKSKKGTTDTFKGGKSEEISIEALYEEVERLREENEALKRKLTKKDIKPVPVRNRSTVKASVKDHTEADIEKEQELLRTLERIKKKLRRSITKKLQEEKQKKIKEVKEEAQAKAFGRNYVPAPAYGTTYHDVLRKKIYGESKKVRRDNTYLLHRGIPVSYNKTDKY